MSPIHPVSSVPASSDIIVTAGDDIRESSLALTENALTVLKARYLKKDENGQPVEEPVEMFRRVAHAVAGAEVVFGAPELGEKAEKLFFNLMAECAFLPNSPTLMNAGRELGQLSACFVLPVDDSMDSIFQAVKDAAIIHKSGGGTGFSFSRLRPKNDVVRSTHGISSGPVSFMAVFDAATETIKQGGTRRGANMGILRVDHPDIREFITCKNTKDRFANFNISVAVTDEFMKAVRKNGEYNLVNPRTGETFKREKARDIFDMIVENAHDVGDPGIVFIDRINEHNPLKHIGDIESTNPCGEQPLLPYESCNLGSVNLSLMVAEKKGKPVIDWDKLAYTVKLAVRFLDNVIEINRYPLPAIAEQTKQTRKIGLGVMGFADMLIKLGISYDSAAAEKLAGEVMAFVDRTSKDESRHLAAMRGAFPAFTGSAYDLREEAPQRNATTTTIAPTGTISIIASCSSGIEPLFALMYRRNVLDGKQLIEYHPIFRAMIAQAGLLTEAFERQVAETGGVEHIPVVPEPIRAIFRTAREIPVEWHIKVQAAFQRYTDNAVSKTVNFPHEAAIQDVAAAYMQAYDAGLKGITIYRDGSREGQVLTTERPKPSRKHPLMPRPRPQVTQGATEKLVTGCGNLYVTVNKDEHGLCEVFCQMGRSGGCTSSQSEAVSRLISIALRSGVKLDEIVSQLKGIRCPSSIWSNGKLILSCSDAIATALSRYLKEENGAQPDGGNPVPELDKDADADVLAGRIIAGKRLKGEMAGVCPDCGGVLETSEGCLVCRTCGFSKCG